jgi:nitrite transporter NirC
MRGTVSWGRAGATLLACLGGNLLGAMVLATVVHLSGALGPSTAAGQTIARMIQHKAAESGTQLFFRGVLCNLMVCLAVWCAARLRSEGARLVMIFACVAVFITSGFEHVVANMTTFSFGLVGGLPGATWLELGRNVLLVGLGNLVGGGLLVGAAYAYSARPAPAPRVPSPLGAAPAPAPAAGPVRGEAAVVVGTVPTPGTRTPDVHGGPACTAPGAATREVGVPALP